MKLFEKEQYEEFNETLWCLFCHGPTWDGNLPSKQERDDLVEQGLVCRYDGWQTLTEKGLEEAVKRGLGDRKEAENNR